MARKPSVLDEAWAKFIRGGVSILVGSRDAANVPASVRALGCRTSADRRRMTLLVARDAAAPVLAGFQASRTVTVVITQPSTHLSIQLKGRDPVCGPASPDDVRLAERYVDSFVAELTPLGYAEAWVRAVMWFDPMELGTVTFAPDRAFLQTPGPRAGVPLAES